MVFYSNRDGPFHIFKQSIDATQAELLVGGKDDLYLPRLTPDSSSVLYVVRAKAGGPSDNAKVMRVPLAGGPPQFVLEAPGIFDVECARPPSTLCMYAQIQAGQARFFTLDPVKGKGMELSGLKGKRDSFNWCFSPNGKYCAWPSDRTTFKKFGIRSSQSPANGSKTSQYLVGRRFTDWIGLWTPWVSGHAPETQRLNRLF